MYAFLKIYICMYVYYMYAWYLGGKKTALDHLQLKLQMFVSHYVGVGKGSALNH